MRYEAVNAMLLNEFLKEHRKVEAEIGKEQALEKTVAEQQQTIAGLSRELEEQVSQMREVTTALNAIRSAPRIAENRGR